MPMRKPDTRKSDGPVVVAAPAPAPAASSSAASAAAATVEAVPSDEEDYVVATRTSTATSTSPATKTPPSEATAVVAMADRKDKEHKSDTKDSVSIEDLALPKSIITRLAKGILPPNTQIQANAILALSKGATVFISYLASHANEHTKNAGKKTISPADVFKALDDTDYSFLREPLEAEFAKFSAVQTKKRSSYRQKALAAKDGLTTKDDDDTDVADAKAVSEPSVDGPCVKRPRVQPPSRDTAETEVDEDSDAAGIQGGGEEEEADDDDEGDEDDEDNDDDDDGTDDDNGTDDEDDDNASSDETQKDLRRKIPDEDDEDNDESD